MRPISSRMALTMIPFLLTGLGAFQEACAQHCCPLSSRTSDSEKAFQKAGLSGTRVEAAKFYLQVGGMTCPSCASVVQTALSGAVGVTKATVDLSHKRAMVTVESGRVGAEALVNAVEQAGFTAMVLPVETVCLSVSGMTCEACAASVQKALVAVEGVEEASVDFESATACVVRVKRQSPLDALQRAVTAAGGDRHSFRAEPVPAARSVEGDSQP